MSKYNIGDKFVIEIDELLIDCVGDEVETDKLYRIKGFNSLVFDDNGLDKLEKFKEKPPIPYSAAYNKGREDALMEVQNCESYGYNKGLEDAWKLAQKICTNYNIRHNVFEYSYAADILDNYTPQEALAKLEAYEKAQEIKVGDVVTDKNHTTEILVTEIDDDENTFSGIKATPTDELGNLGGVYSIMPIGNYKKTGKHIDLADLFKQIGGGEDA